MINNGKAVAKPILLKISPDLTQEQLDDVIDLAMEIKLDGLVATNTTVDREGLNHDFKIGSQEAEIALRVGKILIICIMERSILEEVFMSEF